MLALVIAACLTVQATDISPAIQKCSLIRTHTEFENQKACEAYEKSFTKEFERDKSLKITGYRCVDSAKLDAAIAPQQPSTPEKNPVDPKLKPLTPEQKQQGVESL